MIARAVLRIAASIAVVTALYYLLPFDRSSTGVTVTLLVAGLVVFVVLVAFQVRAIAAAPFPGLRAIKAITSAVRRGRQRQPQDADHAQRALLPSCGLPRLGRCRFRLRVLGF